jgi:hypothetical protein
MLERYSHIRMAAKRVAVEALSEQPKRANRGEVSTVPTTLEHSQQVQ